MQARQFAREIEAKPGPGNVRQLAEAAEADEQPAHVFGRDPNPFVADRDQGLRSALAARVANHPLSARLTRTALHTRFTWYALGSVVAFVSSNVVFLLLYLMSASTTICSVGGFVAGAIPNWVLNRRWAWKRSGRPVFGREVIGYILVSTVVLVTTSAVTGWTNAMLQPPPPHVLNILVAAQSKPKVGKAFVNGFDDPRTFFPWLADPAEAEKFVQAA